MPPDAWLISSVGVRPNTFEVMYNLPEVMKYAEDLLDGKFTVESIPEEGYVYTPDPPSNEILFIIIRIVTMESLWRWWPELYDPNADTEDRPCRDY